MPAEHHTDNFSVCFRNRDGSYAGDSTSRCRVLCAKRGVVATRNNCDVAQETGAIEGPHSRLIGQQLGVSLGHDRLDLHSLRPLLEMALPEPLKQLNEPQIRSQGEASEQQTNAEGCHRGKHQKGWADPVFWFEYHLSRETIPARHSGGPELASLLDGSSAGKLIPELATEA